MKEIIFTLVSVEQRKQICIMWIILPLIGINYISEEIILIMHIGFSSLYENHAQSFHWFSLQQNGFCGLKMDKNQKKVLDLLNEKGIYAK